MVKKCDITGTGVMSGNNVSHANNKTRRRFLPNLHIISLFSEVLNQTFKLKICSKTLRSIEHNGGLDSYLETTASSKLSNEALKIKNAVIKKKGGKTKPVAATTPRSTPARIAKKNTAA